MSGPRVYEVRCICSCGERTLVQVMANTRQSATRWAPDHWRSRHQSRQKNRGEHRLIGYAVTRFVPIVDRW